jgi:hypothetical protein
MCLMFIETSFLDTGYLLSGEFSRCQQPEPSVILPLLYTRSCENGKHCNTAKNVVSFVFITVYCQGDEMRAVKMNCRG